MGYYINMVESDWTVPVENQEAALAAVIALYAKFEASNDLGFINNYALANATTLPEAMEACRYLMDDTGTITEFTGQKIGRDEQLFHTLAPYSQPGSFISFQGEDNEFFSYELNAAGEFFVGENWVNSSNEDALHQERQRIAKKLRHYADSQAEPASVNGLYVAAILVETNDFK